MLARIERVTDERPTGTSWPSIDCDALNRNWEQARADLIESYFDARAELVKRQAESAA